MDTKPPKRARERPKQAQQTHQESDLRDFGRAVRIDFYKWLIVVLAATAARAVGLILVAWGLMDPDEMTILVKVHLYTTIVMTVELGLALCIDMALASLKKWRPPNEL
jgi:hypothetical protein